MEAQTQKQSESKSNGFKTLLTIFITIVGTLALVFAVVTTKFDIKTAFNTLSGVVTAKIDTNKPKNSNVTGSTSPSKNTAYVAGDTAAPRVLGTTAPIKNSFVVTTSTYTTTTKTSVKNTTDTQAPDAKVTYPKDGSHVTTDSDVSITAYISDNVAVTKVRYYINDELECEDNSEPFITKCIWNVPSKSYKKYKITVKAYDAQGNVGENSITVKSDD